MADTSAQAEIRGIDIQKLVEGFAEEGIILKNFCRVMPATAREIRWFQKTAGFLTGPTTTAITTLIPVFLAPKIFIVDKIP